MSKEKFVRDKPHVNIGTIIFAIFGVISLFSLGMMIYIDIMETRDSDGDSIPDLTESSTTHPLFFDILDDSLIFRTYETVDGTHEVGHHLGISHAGFSSHINILLGLFDDVSTMAPILDFNIKYDSLIEFIDGNSNGFFDPTTDTIIGKTTLNNMVRSGFGFGVDGEPAYNLNYSTVDGVFKVEFFTAREHVLLSRQVGLLSPFQLKSIITITQYTPITGTNLALNLSLSSNHEIIFSGTTLSATSSSGNYKAAYEWYDSAIINGVEAKVNTTTPSSPIPLNIGSIYINFGEIVNGTYDPKLSWVVPNTDNFSITNIPWNYITIGSIGIIAIGAMTKTPRGKKKKKEEPKPPPSKFDSIATEVTPSGDKESEPGRKKSDPTSSDSEDHVPRKKPGRLKFSPAPSVESTENIPRDSEKRIPSTLRHRDR